MSPIFSQTFSAKRTESCGHRQGRAAALSNLSSFAETLGGPSDYPLVIVAIENPTPPMMNKCHITDKEWLKHVETSTRIDVYIYIYICELVVIDDYEPTWSIGLNVV